MSNISPVLITRVATFVPMIQGFLSSRANIAACDRAPPSLVINPAISQIKGR